jgi:hypothetical protein
MRPDFAHLDSPAIKRLMLKMLYPSPDRRISIQDAISDRWVKTVDCCSVEDYGTKENAIDAAGRKSVSWQISSVSRRCTITCHRRSRGCHSIDSTWEMDGHSTASNGGFAMRVR